MAFGKLKPLRISSWNINGLRRQITRLGTLSALLQSLEADIICFQETKVRRGDLERELALAEGWDSYFSSTRGPTGYAGVATFCRRGVTSVVHAEEGFTGTYVDAAAQPVTHTAALPLPPGGWPDLTPDQLQALDAEGRCVITDHGAFVLVNVYGPAITSEERAEERAAFKVTFYQALGERLAAFLAAQRPVILLGDLNISPYPIDSCSPSPDFEQSPSRQWLRQQLVEGGGCLLDVFRACHPLQREAYTCWSTATGARVNNYGTRIDLVLAGQPRVTLGSLVTGCPHGCALSQRRQQPQQQQQHEQQQQQQQQATTSLPGLQPSVQQPQQQGEGQQRGQEQQQEQGHLRGGPTSQHLLTPVAAGAEPASSITTSSSSSSPLPHHLLEVPVACPCLALWSWVAGCDIWAAHQGSDHAPVVLQLAVPQVLLPQGCPSPPLSSSNVFKGRQCSLKGWLQAAAAGQPVAGASTGPGVQQAAENRMQHTQSAGGFSQSSQQQQQPQGAAEHHRVLSQTNGNDPIRSTGSQPNSSSCGASSTAGTNGGSSQGAGWAQAAATGSRKRGAGKGSSAGQQTLAGWVSKQGKQPGATPLVTPAGATRAGGFACQPANLQRQQPPQPLPQPQPTVPQGPPAAMHQEQPQDAQQLWQAPLNTQSTAGAAAVAAQPHTGGDWTTAGDAGDPGGGQGGDVAAHGDRHTQALAAWQRIQQAMAPPKCKGHGEPCKIQTVKKKGPNNGRQFYVCSRADGPPPVGRCDHFEWCRHREVRGQVLKRPGTAGAGQAHKRPASASK